MVEAGPSAAGNVSRKKGVPRKRCSHAFKTVIYGKLTREVNGNPYTHRKVATRKLAWEKDQSRDKVLDFVRGVLNNNGCLVALIHITSSGTILQAASTLILRF